MKKSKWIVGAIMMAFFLTGCSNVEQDATCNTLIVNGDSTLIDVSVEDYTGITYDEEELKSFINDAIDEYNSDSENAVKLKSFTNDNDNIKLVMSYASIDDYNAFNQTEYILDDAERIALDGSFTTADGKSIEAADLELSNAKALVLYDATNVVLDGTLLYYNEEVTVSDTDALTVSGEDTAIIIYQ